MKRKIQFLLLLIISGLVVAGVYTQKDQNPEAPIVPEEIMGPLLELQAMIDQQQPSMNGEVQDLVKDVQDRFYALDDAPQLTPEDQRGRMEERKNKPEMEPTTDNRYGSPGEAFDKITSDISGAMDKLVETNAGDLAERVAEIINRAKFSLDKTKEGVSNMIEQSSQPIPKEDNDDTDAATH